MAFTVFITSPQAMGLPPVASGQEPWRMNNVMIIARERTLVVFIIVCFLLVFEAIFDSMSAGIFVRLYVNMPARMAIGVAKK